MEAKTTRLAPQEVLRLNPERKPLTPEKLRELSGMDLTDEQAQEIIFSIRTFSAILFELVKENEPEIISIKPNIHQQKIAA